MISFFLSHSIAADERATADGQSSLCFRCCSSGGWRWPRGAATGQHKTQTLMKTGTNVTKDGTHKGNNGVVLWKNHSTVYLHIHVRIQNHWKKSAVSGGELTCDSLKWQRFIKTVWGDLVCLKGKEPCHSAVHGQVNINPCQLRKNGSTTVYYLIRHLKNRVWV